MGIKAPIHEVELYETAIKKLFPSGDYWNKQFANPQSDVSLFCKAKLPEFLHFRNRMSALLNESKVCLTEELLDEWEKLLFGTVFFVGTSVSIRRAILLQKFSRVSSSVEIQQIAQIFGYNISEVQLPYRPAFFGFSSFGINRIAGPAFQRIIYISVNVQENSDMIEKFENILLQSILINFKPYFFYNGGK